VTKHAARATTPAEIPALVRTAFDEVRSGRPRPVEIEIPPDTLFAVGDVELLPAAPEPARPAGDPDLLAAAARLLTEARQPLIWAGGGVLRSGAGAALAQLAETLQAPVVLTQNGKGAVSDRNPLTQNVIAGIELIKDADVVLAVGTRFVDPATAKWGLGPGRNVIQIDIDPDEVGRNYPPTVAIVADARAALEELARLADRGGRARPSRTAALTELKAAVAARTRAVGPQADYALAIRDALPDDGIFVSEVTQVGYWSNIAFPVYQPDTYISPGYQGTLGYGFPTALGAKVGKPSTPVVSIAGDGGFGFCLNELSTMARHEISAVVVVFSDDAYGNVRRIQQEQFGGRTIASDLRNPDFMKLADAFGVAGRRAASPAALTATLGEAFAANEPTLIAVPQGRVPNPWTKLGLR
jgi:acetolactate synthase-1/2/3 large subunit